MSSDPEDAPPVSVVAAIVVDDPTALPETLEAVRRQVYEPARIVVVAGSGPARLLAEAEGVPTTPALGALLDSLPADITHLWFVNEGAMPRPDALGRLVAEADRIGAGIAGSKILDRTNPTTMVSVGVATDVFEMPYTGLEPGERDQGQYDVVRDVAALAGVSMLIRRDLARGVRGPDPAMAPAAAAVDLCQRARLRGARIAVIPSSEVLYPAAAVRGRRWREDAGRIRAMLKSYGALTLAWAVPAVFLIGLLEVILAPFTGRWRLFDFVKAWTWNVVALPDTIRLRLHARRGRTVGDDELFRFQRRGSVTVSTLFGEMASAIRRRLPGEDRLSLEALGRDLRQPAFVTGILAIVFTLLAVRTIWSSGLPAVGYSLPFPDSGWDGVLAYAGGWNPAGLGSPEPLMPYVAVTGIVQTMLFGKAALAEYAFTFGTYVLGIWGVVRLLRTWSIEAAPGVAAGVVYVAGPAAQGIAANTDLGVLFALAVVPWALRVALARFPTTLLGRIGRLAAAAFTIALTAALAPLLLILPVGGLVLWAVLNPTDVKVWRAVAFGAGGTVIALPLLVPWIVEADLHRYVAAGDAFWEPWVVAAVAVATAVALTLLAAPPRLAVVSGWGAILVAGGALGARSADLGPGLAAESAALAAVALGSAAIVGAALEAVTRVGEIAGWRRFAVGMAAASVLLLVATSLLPLVGGRAGLPGDRFAAAFEFTTARPGDAAASRILVVGPPDELPGDSRLIRGASYRLVSAPLPDHLETHLADSRPGDDALVATLNLVIDGDTQRVGALLAPFGVRWIVVTGDAEGSDADPRSTAWLNVLEGQLDLVPLGGALPHPTFANEVSAVRATTSLGRIWLPDGLGYTGPAEVNGRVAIADNVDDRWGPGEWAALGWGNEVSAREGRAVFDAIEWRRLAAAGAGAGMLILAAAAWLGRRAG